MQFNTFPFLFYFLPAFLAVYYIAPRKLRAAVLTLSSLVFYWFAVGGNLSAVGLLVIFTLTGYFVDLAAGSWGGRTMAGISVAFFGAALAFLKLYRGGALLAAGMSFYIFQLIAYTVDARRRGEPVERNFFRYFGAVLMFPKLLAGPIAESEALQKRLARAGAKKVTFHMGLQELILGLGLKVLLADRVGVVWGRATVLGLEGVSTPFAWLALVSFCMKLYFDFYGYSLMAVGLGHMVGVHLPMNFLEPYSAKTVSEFFRRWHASLGRWFREYVYIPLGGNRRGMARTILNLALVWALTGLWHGVKGGYLLWAGLLFLLIANERLWMRKHLEKTRVLCHVYTVAAIVLTWAAFAAGSWGGALSFYARLFGVGPGAGSLDDFLYWGRIAAPVMIAGAFFMTPVPKKLWLRVKDKKWADALLFCLFWVCVYFMATSSGDPFVYFNF